MQQIRFPLNGDFIELFKLLKILNISSTGGEAKVMIDQGLIKVNDKVDTRKRAKIKPGDVVKAGEIKIYVEP
ncbi:MAG: RNA-binding S4 domain-containing protein [Bacteroidota bacterium]